MFHCMSLQRIRWAWFNQYLKGLRNVESNHIFWLIFVVAIKFYDMKRDSRVLSSSYSAVIFLFSRSIDGHLPVSKTEHLSVLQAKA